ncbi:hypothetical protein [Paenarthrobacter ureafaciens]|uniref:hypothetical protein n=1 Tax=Paenarthrobacter ureafaciens TaxID=37931 RepID=UPI001FB4FF93|nr:hypothetical protein [Paenarthrobacter ureafaciens]UOD83479.1 hypothetical protein MQZ73_20810 [Paenarthrobacter ureafaciens]
MGQKDHKDQQSRDANEWYWINRFGHSLVNHYSSGLMGQTSYSAGPLTEEEIDRLTPEDLAVLACSASVEARTTAAHGEATPSSSLARLAFDSERDVRWAAGHNSSTPAAAILRMSGRNSDGTRNYEVSEHRLEFLWAELDSVPVDRKLALEVADGRYEDWHRVALARKTSVSVDILTRLAACYRLPPEAALELAKNNHIQVRSSLAANGSTTIPAEVLVGLAADAAPEVRAAAATNYNLPDDVLLRLLDDESAEVRHAVIVHGYLSYDVQHDLDREDESRRSLQERLRSHKWSGYGRYPEEDGEESPRAALLRKLAGSPYALTRAAVAQSPETPIDVLEELAGDTEEDVISAISYGLGYDTANRFVTGGYAFTTIWWYRRLLSRTEFSSLLNSPVALLRALGAARYESFLQKDPEAMSRLARDAAPVVRAAAATSPYISFLDLVELASDADETVQQAASSSIIDWLRRQQEPHIPYEQREHFDNNWLARMESVPDGVPELLGKPDWNRLSIGRIPVGWFGWSVGDEELELLAKSESIAVRAAVASYLGPHESRHSRVRLTPEVIALLVRDKDSTVRERALRNTSAAAVSLAASSEAPAEALVHYARSSNPDLRRAIAANPLTPGPILANIVRDTEDSVRAAIAANPATPGEALVVLAGDQSEEVLLGLLANANTPQTILEQQANRPADYGEAQRHRTLAINASSPAHILAKIAYSRSGEIRELVARNPNTAMDTLEILAFDEHPRVRAAAKHRLQRD